MAKRNSKRNGKAKTTVRVVASTTSRVNKRRATKQRMMTRNVNKSLRGGSSGIAVAYAPRANPTVRDSASPCGTDRILAPVSIQNYVFGQIIASILIEPFITARMATLARAYQKIEYVSMRFRVIAQTSSMAAGGYICGFLTDPADLLPEDKSQRGAYLITNTGAQVRNWWTSTTVSTPMKRKVFYTNPPEVGANDLREYSPGRFILISDAPAGQTGFISVELDWCVHFTEATLQDTAAAITFSAPEEYYVSGALTSSGTPDDFAGELRTVNGLAVTPALLAAKGINLSEGDSLVMPVTIPMTMTAGTYQQSIASRFFKAVGNRLLAAALNRITGTIQVCNNTWQESNIPISAGGVPFTPFTNNRPMTTPAVVCPEGSTLQIVDETALAITPEVYRYRSRRDAVFRALDSLSTPLDQGN